MFSLFHKEKNKRWREKSLRLGDFVYDKNKDEFICKNNARLSLVDKFEEVTKTGYVKTIHQYMAQELVCVGCPFRALCTKSKARTLDVSWKGERLKQQAKVNLESEKGKELIRMDNLITKLENKEFLSKEIEPEMAL